MICCKCLWYSSDLRARERMNKKLNPLLAASGIRPSKRSILSHLRKFIAAD